MLLGGANQPFETTYRVVCYSFGSTAIFQLIPICGSRWIGGVWNIVVTSIGIAKAHEIPTGKGGPIAVLLPLICCCGLMIVVFVLILPELLLPTEFITDFLWNGGNCARVRPTMNSSGSRCPARPSW